MFDESILIDLSYSNRALDLDLDLASKSLPVIYLNCNSNVNTRTSVLASNRWFPRADGRDEWWSAQVPRPRSDRRSHAYRRRLPFIASLSLISVLGRLFLWRASSLVGIEAVIELMPSSRMVTNFEEGFCLLQRPLFAVWSLLMCIVVHFPCQKFDLFPCLFAGFCLSIVCGFSCYINMKCLFWVTENDHLIETRKN